MHKAVLALEPIKSFQVPNVLSMTHPPFWLPGLYSKLVNSWLPLGRVGRHRKLLWRVGVDKQSQGMARQGALTCMCVCGYYTQDKKLA